MVSKRHKQKAHSIHETGKSEQWQLLEPFTVFTEQKEDGDLTQRGCEQRPADYVVAGVHALEAKRQKSFIHPVPEGQDKDTAEEPQHFLLQQNLLQAVALYSGFRRRACITVRLRRTFDIL
ncbi:hypothetical protein D3C80_1533910 [compost metagenome]